MRVNIHVRKEDEGAWGAIGNKSEWIHNQLQGIDNTNDVSRVEIPSISRNSSGFCKEGHSIPEGRSKCLGKGCKFSF